MICIFLATVAFAQPVRWGADLSFVPKLEHNGAVFRRAGYERDVLEIFRSAGVEVIRMRLWHTPSEPWSGIDSVIAFAERADALGFKLLLDLHYSDSWADPTQQTKPVAWQSLTYAQLEDSVYRYTNEVVLRFRDADILPNAIQIGNEIGGGFLWTTGRVGGAYDTPQQWTQFTNLLKAGINGVRDSLSEPEWPEIVIHHQEGGDAAACNWFYSHLEDYNVPFDIIGLSYYPWWHGSLDDLSANVAQLVNDFGKSVQIVETAYPWMTGWCDNENNIVWEDTPLLPAYPATELGQAFYLGGLRDRLEAVPNLSNKLICYWEPAWIPTTTFGSPWENLALFDCDGDALQVFNVFPGLAPQKLTITRIGNDLRLRWPDDANLYYRLYADESSDGAFTTLIGSTTAHEYLLPNEFNEHNYRFFVVRGSATP